MLAGVAHTALEHWIAKKTDRLGNSAPACIRRFRSYAVSIRKSFPISQMLAAASILKIARRL
jgi:hypothetical protein